MQTRNDYQYECQCKTTIAKTDVETVARQLHATAQDRATLSQKQRQKVKKERVKECARERKK
jgi:hypothetical protein